MVVLMVIPQGSAHWNHEDKVRVNFEFPLVLPHSLPPRVPSPRVEGAGH